MSLQSIFLGNDVPSDAIGARALWLSTALMDARFPEHPGQTWVAYDIGSSVQEPNCYYYNGLYYLFANAGGSLQMLVTADPESPPYTKLGVTLGAAATADTGGVTHPGLFVENGIVYLYYINGAAGTSIKCAYATLAALEQVALGLAAVASPWTVVTVATKAGLGSTHSQFGNFSMAVVNGLYYLYIEATAGNGGDGWVTSVASCATPTGTFTMLSGALASMSPLLTFGFSGDIPVMSALSNGIYEGYRSGYSCAPIFRENGLLVQLFHASAISSGDGGQTSDLYRAYSPENDGLNWTVDLGGWPVYMRRDTRYELDQVADCCYCQGPNGIWYAFWTGANNDSNRFVIKGAALAPTLKMFNGRRWVPVDQQGVGATLPRALVQRTRYALTGQPIFPFESIPVDPGSTANFAVTLPPAFAGNECEVLNVATTGTYYTSTTVNTGTVLPAAGGTDVIYGSNPALNPGQCVRYVCRKKGVWCRMG